MPKLIQCIQSEITRGLGTEDSPIRRVIQYHTPDGDFLAEYDTMEKMVYDSATGKYKIQSI